MANDNLTLTKSKTSRISRPTTKSPIKKGASLDLKPRRPLDSTEKPSREKRESVKLKVTHHHLPADPSLLFSDVLAGINYLTGIQFPPFPQRGLGRDRIAELYSARKVSFAKATHTQIERELSNLMTLGVVRKVLLHTSAEPGQGTCATRDFGVILSSTYVSLLSVHGDLFGAFREWIAGPGAAAVSVPEAELHRQGVNHETIRRLFEFGFLTLEYSLGGSGYTISVPGAGNLVRNLRGGRKELLRVLKRQTYHEILEKNLISRKLKESILSYSFHLHELVGSGRVEVFMTPAGRGIKITSKGLAEVG